MLSRALLKAGLRPQSRRVPGRRCQSSTGEPRLSTAGYGQAIGRSTRPKLEEAVPRIAGLLGAAGLIPFVFYAAQHSSLDDTAAPRGDKLINKVEDAVGLPGALRFFKADNQAGVRRLFNTYAASILSFMGAVHWGVAMKSGIPRQYAVSVLPSLVGWVALNTAADRVPAFTLACGFIGVYFYDEHMARQRVLPPWYSKLRTPLTFAVVASCMAAFRLSRPRDRMRGE